MRPTPTLTELQQIARSSNIATDPHVFGTARPNRHSFSRSLIRHAANEGWKVKRRIWDLDDKGQGIAVFTITMGTTQVELVIFSQVIDESIRTDRVIAQDWDITAALVNEIVTPQQLEVLSHNVTKQEDGRADVDALVWGRANRSQRFFDYIVDCLSRGVQPDAENVGDAPYLIRSTAFYGNGKFGLRDFEGLDREHPLSTPYRAQMLAAWVLREFSLQLVEHCALAISSQAVSLAHRWKRSIGIGNATGLGMVPYPIRHPQVMDAWIAARELALAHALRQSWKKNSEEVMKFSALIERTLNYFSAKQSFSTAPYPAGTILAGELEKVSAITHEFMSTGKIEGKLEKNPALKIHEISAAISQETVQIVESLLIEIDSSLDEEIEQLLYCTDRTFLNPKMPLSELSRLVKDHYSWCEDFDFAKKAETARFWFYSRNNQEPRRGLRGKDRGLKQEHPVGVAYEISELLKCLAQVSDETKVGTFVVQYPQHWGIVERVQSVATLPYAEARVNPLSDNFLPLDLQRFQLATYGMENFNPQSTDWLRVTLYGGAPTVEDVETSHDVDDWLFVPMPGQNA